MKKYDEAYREGIHEDIPQMPKDMAYRIDQTLANLPTKKRVSLWKPAVAFALFLFILLPNVNTTVAQAMEEIPILGKLVKVITIHKIEYEEQTHFAYVDMPYLETVEEFQKEIANINMEIKTLIDDIVANFEHEVAQQPEDYQGLHVYYDILKNDEDWFTLRITKEYTAASTTKEVYFYHFDKEQGRLVTLKDVCEGYAYVESFSTEVKRQMREQMKADEEVTYWIDGHAPDEMEFEHIDENQMFYFDMKGNIVLVFQEGEVGPDSMGCPEFVIEVGKNVCEN